MCRVWCRWCVEFGMGDVYSLAYGGYSCDVVGNIHVCTCDMITEVIRCDVQSLGHLGAVQIEPVDFKWLRVE